MSAALIPKHPGDAVAAIQAVVAATGSQLRVLAASIRDAADMASLAARVSVGCFARDPPCVCAFLMLLLPVVGAPGFQY